MITKRTAGRVPDGTIPLIDARGNVQGHVTAASTQANVSRFPNMGRGAKLVSMKGGRKEWHAQQPRKVK
jgi:hypothetical protein